MCHISFNQMIRQRYNHAGTKLASILYCQYIHDIVHIITPCARTRGRVIGVSVGCLFVCLFVDTKTSSLSETGQFMSSTYYVPVRNRKILASTYLTNESVRQGAEKSRLKIFSALLKLLFNIVDPCQKNDYYQSGRS